MDVEIDTDKGYAVVEVMNQEIVRLLAGLDYLELYGSRMKIRRPRGFFEVLYDPEEPAKPAEEDAKKPEELEQKIYMSGIPQNMAEDEVRKLVESFGMVKSFHLVKDQNTQQSRGFCFFEYLDAKATDRAIKGLNGIEIRDKRLRVQRATTNQQEKKEKKEYRIPSNAVPQLSKRIIDVGRFFCKLFCKIAG
jgi:splicing factor U2AF subunit